MLKPFPNETGNWLQNSKTGDFQWQDDSGKEKDRYGVKNEWMIVESKKERISRGELKINSGNEEYPPTQTEC